MRKPSLSWAIALQCARPPSLKWLQRCRNASSPWLVPPGCRRRRLHRERPAASLALQTAFKLCCHLPCLKQVMHAPQQETCPPPPTPTPTPANCRRWRPARRCVPRWRMRWDCRLACWSSFRACSPGGPGRPSTGTTTPTGTSCVGEGGEGRLALGRRTARSRACTLRDSTSPIHPAPRPTHTTVQALPAAAQSCRGVLPQHRRRRLRGRCLPLSGPRPAPYSAAAAGGAGGPGAGGGVLSGRSAQRVPPGRGRRAPHSHPVVHRGPSALRGCQPAAPAAPTGPR